VAKFQCPKCPKSFKTNNGLKWHLLHIHNVQYDEAQADSQYRQAAGESNADDFATLYLLPSVPIELVKAAYRTLAKLHHPDMSNSPNATEKMKELNRAYEAIMKRQSTE